MIIYDCINSYFEKPSAKLSNEQKESIIAALLVDELPQGALVRYERDVSAIAHIISRRGAVSDSYHYEQLSRRGAAPDHIIYNKGKSL